MMGRPSQFELLAFATDFREAVLDEAPSDRMCAALSGPLGAALTVLGVGCHLMESDLGECNHVFLQMEDGRVLDPTADQFNWCSIEKLPGVFLGPAAGIHKDAVPWAGGREWIPLMQELKRLYPGYGAFEVGKTVGMILRSLPNQLGLFSAGALQ